MRFVENSLCEYASLLREQGLSEEKIFGKLLEEFNGTPYVLGGVTVDGCDCSGTVCAALNALYSKDLRTTAHGLYTQVFTEPFVDENRIHAVFCMAVDKHGDVRAVHVAGYMGENLYMNESSCEPLECGHVRTLSELRRIYSDCFLVRRNLRSGAWA